VNINDDAAREVLDCDDFMVLFGGKGLVHGLLDPDIGATMEQSVKYEKQADG
jgi:hypothetical protein